MRKIFAALVLCLSFSFTAAADYPSAGEVADGWSGYNSAEKNYLTGIITGTLFGIERFTSNMGYPLNNMERECLSEIFLPKSIKEAGQLVVATKGYLIELEVDPYGYAFHDAFVYFAQSACLSETLQGAQEDDDNVGS